LIVAPLIFAPLASKLISTDLASAAGGVTGFGGVTVVGVGVTGFGRFCSPIEKMSMPANVNFRPTSALQNSPK
jgi:hypothetical protein